MMTNPEKSIIAALIYYDLLNRPLTALEIFKYLAAGSREISFFEIRKILDSSNFLKKTVSNNGGLYFLKNRENLVLEREKRLKLSQLKWKKFKRTVRWLALVPFLRLAAATGSLTAYNSRPESDFDLLIVAASGRLWLTRTLTTALLGFLGARRHGSATRDKVCLNCYLAGDNPEIKPEAKPRDLHSAQEYGRLSPVLEIKSGVYQEFVRANNWLKIFLNFYPWPNSQTAKKIKENNFLGIFRQLAEWCLRGKAGDWLERKLGRWQRRRIEQKNETSPADQIYISDQCLMFHPQSKSYELMKRFDLLIRQLADS